MQALHTILKYVIKNGNAFEDDTLLRKDCFPFFLKFLAEKNLAKKRKILLRDTQCGFIGDLLQILISIAGPVIPKLLEPPAQFGDYPTENIVEDSDYVTTDDDTSDDETSSDGTSDDGEDIEDEEGEMEEGEEEGEEDEDVSDEEGNMEYGGRRLQN